MTYAIRPATAGDRVAVERITLRAYQPWVDVVGGRPGPMDDDFAARIAGRRVYVAVASAETGGSSCWTRPTREPRS